MLRCWLVYTFVDQTILCLYTIKSTIILELLYLTLLDFDLPTLKIF